MRSGHVDIAEDPEYEVAGVVHAGFRTVLSVPMLRDGDPIGAITVTRQEGRPFSDTQVALLQTFANQAVIAIENVRLFTETKEALEQQTATAEILRVIASSPTDLQPVFDAIVRTAARLCEASYGFLARYDGMSIAIAAHSGATDAEIAVVLRVYPMAPTPASLGGRAILERATVHIPDVRSDPTYGHRGIQEVGWRTGLGVPLLREGAAIGVLGMWRRDVRPFSDRQIALLQTFATQALIAIENVRLFKELEQRNRDLTETLEQQTATAEILRVIASSPTDLQPVLKTIAENAARVCGATDSMISRVEGDHLRVVALQGPLRRSLAIGDLVPVSRDILGGRVVIDRQTIQVADVMAAETEAEFPVSVARVKQTGSLVRTAVATPLLREGTPLGVIIITRGPEVQPFSAKQIALLETFADQAVIAIENVRLFKELEVRNREVTEALEQQTATGQILGAISTSPTDIQPIFDVMCRSAVRLCEAVFSTVAEVSDQKLSLRDGTGSKERSSTPSNPASRCRSTVQAPRPRRSDGGPCSRSPTRTSRRTGRSRENAAIGGWWPSRCSAKGKPLRPLRSAGRSLDHFPTGRSPC
jgi:two-component system, NtrC family, sensor kinase